jgi:ribonuclease P protein component
MNQMIKDNGYEAHLSTQQNQTRPNARVPKKNVHQTGPAHHQSPKSQRSQATCIIKPDFRPGFPSPQSAVFKKKDRILKRKQFQKLSQAGSRIHNPYFIAVFQPTRVAFPRLGVTVSKKVGGAVARNRIKRLVREFFRCHRELLPGSCDLNIIAKKEASGLTAGETFANLERLFKNIANRCAR